MTHSLASESVKHYEREGYVYPVRVLGDDEVKYYRERYEEFEDRLGRRLRDSLPRERRPFFQETHTVLPWVFDLASHPRILNAIESLLGPNLLIWSTQWFPKPPRDPGYINWHQDGVYWRLQPPLVCTAWVALTASDTSNGCLRIVPASHLQEHAHTETYADDSGLSRGQEIAVEVDEASAHDLVLAPGEISIHHIGLIHGSKPNLSDHARIGLAVRFVSPQVEHRGGERPWGMLVRGRDSHHHFELVDPPTDEEERPDDFREQFL